MHKGGLQAALLSLLRSPNLKRNDASGGVLDDEVHAVARLDLDKYSWIFNTKRRRICTQLKRGQFGVSNCDRAAIGVDTRHLAACRRRRLWCDGGGRHGHVLVCIWRSACFAEDLRTNRDREERRLGGAADCAPCGILTCMRRHVRAIVMMLLLAMPLQAFAAASMLFCGRVTHDTWLGHVIAAVSDQTFSHHDGSRTDAHDDGDRHGDGEHYTLHHFADSCSACSDCCCPTTLTAAEPFEFGSDGHSDAIPYVDLPFSGAVPDRFDRPPRSTLA